MLKIGIMPKVLSSRAKEPLIPLTLAEPGTVLLISIYGVYLQIYQDAESFPGDVRIKGAVNSRLTSRVAVGCSMSCGDALRSNLFPCGETSSSPWGRRTRLGCST